jgi:hypothetical protein
MEATTVTQLIPVLQTAVSPVILISGVGLILLTMTNRLGRIVDRSRVMATDLPNMQGNKHERIERELHILWKRARLMRLAIGGVTLSALASAILVIVLFVSTWLKLDAGWLLGGLFILSMGALCVAKLDAGWLLGGLFILSMGALCVALLVFIREIHFSLQAIALEIEGISNHKH